MRLFREGDGNHHDLATDNVHNYPKLVIGYNVMSNEPGDKRSNRYCKDNKNHTL